MIVSKMDFFCPWSGWLAGRKVAGLAKDAQPNCSAVSLRGPICLKFLHRIKWEVPISATVPPALHGVLFEIRLFLAGTSSGTSADVRESDKGERDESLSGGRLPEISENVAL